MRHYKEIVNSVRPFRQKISLSDLTPILVAGWKDAGPAHPQGDPVLMSRIMAYGGGVEGGDFAETS